MAGDVAQDLTDHVRDRAGDSLRTVVIVNSDDLDVVYLREDLQQDYSKERFAEVVDIFRFEEPFLSPNVQNEPIGERRAVLHYHEHACVIQLPYSESQTILVSMDRDAGRHLVEFIETCRQIVKG